MVFMQPTYNSIAKYLQWFEPHSIGAESVLPLILVRLRNGRLEGVRYLATRQSLRSIGHKNYGTFAYDQAPVVQPLFVLWYADRDFT